MNDLLEADFVQGMYLMIDYFKGSSTSIWIVFWIGILICIINRLISSMREPMVTQVHFGQIL